MRTDNDEEGFENQKEVFQVLIPSQIRHLRVKKKEKISIIKEFDCSEVRCPPFSTFVNIKNYLTPNYLNEAYSVSQDTPKVLGSNNAWVAEKETLLDQQFCEANKKYKLIYNKFGQCEKINYNFFGEYGRSQYKTFTDEQFFPKANPHSFLTSIIKNAKQRDLVFSSDFQCGNLEKVYKLVEEQSQQSYFLILSNDTNTVGFNQWFFFQAFNPNHKGVLYRFRIVNMSKKIIKNIKQMGICIFSKQQYESIKKGWIRHASNIRINSQNKIKKQHGQFFTLQFEAYIKPKDVVYFSLSIPYTFTKLYKRIHTFPQFMKIGQTFCGNPIIAYLIGNKQAKKSIFITGRQHPSETSSSFTIDGVLQELQKSTPVMTLFKKKYFIVVLPMVNPDGVIHGNNRTNLMGLDVNRKWESFPDKKFSYQIYHIFHYLLQELPQVQYLIDFHGHSKKLNSFAYFSLKKKLASFIATQMAARLPYFRIKDCQMTENVQINTLRWFAKQFLSAEKAITIQTSVHGWKDENNNIYAFTPQNMIKIGSSLIQVISRISIKKNMFYQKEIQFSKEMVNSDSDPQGDYAQETKKALEEKNKKKIGNRKNYKIRTSEGLKKTALSFKNCNRERIKTDLTEEYRNLQKIGIPFSQTPTSKQKLRKKIKSKEGTKLKISSIRFTNKSLTFKSFHKKIDF